MPMISAKRAEQVSRPYARVWVGLQRCANFWVSLSQALVWQRHRTSTRNFPWQKVQEKEPFPAPLPYERAWRVV